MAPEEDRAFMGLNRSVDRVSNAVCAHEWLLQTGAYDVVLAELTAKCFSRLSHELRWSIRFGDAAGWSDTGVLL